MNHPEAWSKQDCNLSTGETSEYYVYPKGQKHFDRVLVYIHGLVSDIHWFEIPPNLPKGTGILFLPRHPRTHVNSFESWTLNYEERFADFKKSHQSHSYHLLGHCFGALPALHWATVKPENFTTLTLVSIPIVLRKEFDLLTKLGIFFGRKEDPKRCLLTSRSFSRLPRLQRFIEGNPTTTFEFSNSFFLESSRLKRWLEKNVVSYPMPTHCLFSSEDEVVKRQAEGFNGTIKEFPDQTTLIYSDHYAELLPNKDSFWDSVFHFQLAHEIKFELKGAVKKILVTGATGFVGSHIVRSLHAKGFEIVVFARDLQKAREKFRDLAGRIDFRPGNMNDLESIEGALEGIDAVVHTAAHVSDWDRYERFRNINVEGTKNLLMIAHAQGIKQFVHISSLAVFGDTDQVEIDENNRYVLSSDHYGTSKILAEIFVKKYCRSARIPFAVIRPGFIYGEGDINFFPRLIRTLKAKKFRYIGSKENILNAVYVGNVAALVCAVIGNPKSFGETYNISDPERTKIGDFIPQVAESLGLPEPQGIVPKKTALGAAVVLEAVYRTFGVSAAPPVTRKQVTFAGRSRSVNARKAYDFMGRIPFSHEEGMRRTLEALKK